MKKHTEEVVNHFPGFETGWYFPESLRNDPLLDIPDLDEAPLPSFDEYLTSMRRGLAAHALYLENKLLYDEGKLKDLQLIAEIEATEAQIAKQPSLSLPPIQFK